MVRAAALGSLESRMTNSPSKRERSSTSVAVARLTLGCQKGADGETLAPDVVVLTMELARCNDDEDTGGDVELTVVVARPRAGSVELLPGRADVGTGGGEETLLRPPPAMGGGDTASTERRPPGDGPVDWSPAVCWSRWPEEVLMDLRMPGWLAGGTGGSGVLAALDRRPEEGWLAGGTGEADLTEDRCRARLLAAGSGMVADEVDPLRCVGRSVCGTGGGDTGGGDDRAVDTPRVPEEVRTRAGGGLGGSSKPKWVSATAVRAGTWRPPENSVSGVALAGGRCEYSSSSSIGCGSSCAGLAAAAAISF